ncbi:hypothetical protein HMI54_000381 [Coelomomyces lativittatus]|nr:hypothetical protein HMI54_000381 [Coelomomyces lativittatus]
MDQVTSPSHHFILPTSTNKSIRRKASAQIHLHLPHVPSIANIAAAFRASISTFSIQSLAEHPTKTCHPTKLVDGFKVPSFLETDTIPEDVLEWAKSSGPAFNTSGRLIQTSECVQLLHDDQEITFVKEIENCYLYFQVLDASFTSIQQTCDVFYVIYTDKHSYASTSWHTIGKPLKNDAFLIPYSSQLRIAMFLRFPSSDNRRKLFPGFKRKNDPGPLGGTEVALADITMELSPMDFGKESKKIQMHLSPKLTQFLNKQIDLRQVDLTVNLGIWTGASMRIQNEKNASYENYLTIAMNPNQPTMKRYWAKIEVSTLTLDLFDFEVKENKILRTLSLAWVTDINTTKETTSLEHCFYLHWVDSNDLGASQETLVSNSMEWKCNADDPIALNHWVTSLSFSVNLAKKVASRKKNSD